MKLLLPGVAAGLLVVGVGAVAAVSAVGAVKAAGFGQDREVLFFEDFDGPELDRTRWQVIVTGRTVNNEQQANVDSSETLEILPGEAAEGATNGALAIHPRFKPGFQTAEGRSHDFISGRLESRARFEFTYGTAAARMKLAAGAGLWPAFWLLGAGRWPDTGEMDIMENVGDPTWISVALHGPGYSGNTPLVKRYTLPGGRDATGWHVYALTWTPVAFSFHVDDVEVYAVTKPMVEQYGRWAYDNPKFLLLNLALGGQYPRGVNKAGAPYPGLADATVDLIKSGGGTILVDWVRVTK